MIMKKIFKLMMVIALGAMALACAKEPRINEPAEASETVKVNVRMGLPEVEGAGKAQMSDALGITWEAGDVVWFNGNTGNVEATLAATQITNNGHTASFSIEIPAITGQDAVGLLRYNWSTRNSAEYDFGNPAEHKVPDTGATWNSGNSLEYTQAVAGVMNKAYLFMHSNTNRNDQTFVKSDTSPVDVTVNMKIIGSIFRVMPYTSDYNDEAVESVTFSYNDNSVIGGTVVYDYVNGTYRSAQEVNWLTYKTVKVNLGTAFSLSGVTDKATSKGIYFAVPATKNAIAGGYKIVVKTDKATYTYVSTGNVNVSENMVRNIPLKLDAAHRIADDAVKGTLTYEGSIANNQSFNYDHNAQSNIDLGYYFARTQNTGESTSTIRENVSGNEAFYNVSFAVIDDATGTTADWLTVAYGNNSTHWILNAAGNTGTTTRSATVTASFPAIADGYVLGDGFATRVIKVSQNPELAPDTVIGDLSYAQNTTVGASYHYNFGATNAAGLGWLLVTTRISGASSWTGCEANQGDNEALYYAGITCSVIDDATGTTADWVTVYRTPNDTWWRANVSANTGAARSATVTLTFPTFANHYQLLSTESATRVFTISQDAYVAIDYVNELWNGASIAKTFYSDANWTPVTNTPDVTLSADGKTYTVVVPAGVGGNEWNAQNFLLSDIQMTAGKLYKFSCTVDATVSGTATIKLGLWNPTGGNDGKGGDANPIFYDPNVTVTAGTPLVLEKDNLPATINGDMKVVLIIDLGRTAVGSTWTFSNISLKSN